jgi:hypothetical protein
MADPDDGEPLLYRQIEKPSRAAAGATEKRSRTDGTASIAGRPCNAQQVYRLPTTQKKDRL